MKTKTGFSFVELIIAMVILFLAVMVIGSIFPASFKSLLKSKQVTIATTLAQQKLEQCLVNPGDYKTRVGKEGNFSPDHPEYGYSILERQVTDKLKELKVEVYKLVNGKKGIIDAAVAQLVQAGGQKIYYVQYTVGTALPFAALGMDVWRTIDGMIKTIDCPENGVFIISGGYYAFAESKSEPLLVYSGISCDEKTTPRIYTAQHTDAGRILSISTAHTMKITKGKHTIYLIYAANCNSRFFIDGAHMTIQYIPNSLIDSPEENGRISEY